MIPVDALSGKYVIIPLYYRSILREQENDLDCTLYNLNEKSETTKGLAF